MNTFFRALGHHFQKRANRVPWGSVLYNLRKREVIPEVVPRLPFIEPEYTVQPIGPAIPAEFAEDLPEQKKKDGPAPEPRPKSKSEDGEPDND